ncbi:MAG: YbaK/EbsC family protein [Candidatus Glassbacteria bacterium]|nr:YbaK/EbsC family protein [Candidatus Glassbacteria bacterium]
METPVTGFLDQAGVGYVVKPHGREVFTCEEAARERGVRLSQIVKTMVGEDTGGGLHVMMVPGHRTLKLKRVRQAAGGVRIDLIPPGELSQRLGLTVGAISPVQLVGRAAFYMDESIFDEEYVDISSGDPHAGVELRAGDLRALLGALRCRIASTGSQGG